MTPRGAIAVAVICLLMTWAAAVLVIELAKCWGVVC